MFENCKVCVIYLTPVYMETFMSIMNLDLIFLFDIRRFVDCNACVYWLGKRFHTVQYLVLR